ncbi:TPA: hypothetical protein N0F65_010723 [Lagenidium giganteum]|uniref:MACPF domain-containing protein n=1 Tax=Lagenidium giganteum TaxID=4803 RepID=A0AAV2YKJ1_9STRA|nr:TPA: hypothetical protein N0F65_010723 [Lagenidium giganteum]
MAPPGIDYLGAGYDLVYGNPGGSETASSVTDPGFRAHLIKFTWDPKFDTCSGLQKNWTCPKEASILPQPSCIQQSSASQISSTRDFQKVLQQDASVSASVKGSCGGFSASASFSGSKAMASMQRKISVESITSFQSKAVCVEYAATLKMGLSSNNLETLPEFAAAVDELPTVYNSCYQVDSVGGPCPQRVSTGFGDLPMLYGTHYTTRVEMGGKIIHRIEMKQSDVETLRSKKVDVGYGASIKASYKGVGALASASASVKQSSSVGTDSYNAVMSVASKEININIGGSPSDDWHDWAQSASDEPMPVRYTLAPLSPLIAKLDSRKSSLFESAVKDYIAAYGRTLTYDTATATTVTAVEIQYTILASMPIVATFRVMIGKTGDMLPQVVVANSLTGSFRVNVPKQYQVAFDAFQGDIPVTLEYVSGLFTVPKVMMEAKQSRAHWMQMEAALAQKHKKKAPPVVSTPTSVYFTVIQSFAVMSDNSKIPLDDQYAGKQLNAAAPWPINPMD